jgi:hypothetical protein
MLSDSLICHLILQLILFHFSSKKILLISFVLDANKKMDLCHKILRSEYPGNLD